MGDGVRRRVLLWIDLSLKKQSDAAIRQFETFFAVRRARGRSTELTEGDSQPDALCFDFDFPDRPALQLLQQMKRNHPSMPMIMLTVQHSEELAVWAFRTRVWDFIVKPVTPEDVRRCYDSLNRIDPGQRRTPAGEMPPLPAESSAATERRHHRLEAAVAYVTAHLGDKLSERKMAALCGMSVFAYSRAFHAAHGRTFQRFVTDKRIERAQELLRNPDARIADVAALVGFNDPSYFGKVFRRYHSMTPSQWQLAWQNEDSRSARLQLDYPEAPGRHNDPQWR